MKYVFQIISRGTAVLLIAAVLFPAAVDARSTASNSILGSYLNTPAATVAAPGAPAQTQVNVPTCPKPPRDFKCLVQAGINMIGYAIPIIFSLALIVFLYGIIKYIVPSGDEGQIAEGRNMMIFGIIGIAVMSSVWALVKLVTNTLFG